MVGKLRNMTAIYLLCGDKILLLYREGGRVVNNVWVASAGGHFEKEELNDPKTCVLRELKEELGIEESELQGFLMQYVALRRTNGELRQNYYFFAEFEDGMNRKLESAEGHLKWFDLSEIDTMEMPYTAKHVLLHYRETGRFTGKLYGAIGDGKGLQFAELADDVI